MDKRPAGLILLALFLTFILSACSDGGNVNVSQSAAPGSLDTAFATGGVLKAQFANISFLSANITIQPDGKILVPGAFLDGATSGYALVRFNPDGNLDQQFGYGGIVTALPGPNGGGINGIAIQPSGKIIVIGQSYNGSNNDIDVLRFFANGTPDAVWGNQGHLLSSIGTNEIAYGLAVQSDGKLVIVGTIADGSNSDFFIVRFNVDGTLDNSFGINGIVKMPIHPGFAQAFLAYAQHVFIQNDGKVVIAGTVILMNQNTFQDEVVMTRLNSDGSLDDSFGTGGLVTTASGTLTSLLLQEDGKICINILQDIGLVGNEIRRYTPQGVCDGTFAQNGSLVTFPVLVSDLHQDQQGRLVTVGDNWSNNKVEIARYQPDGTRDTSFGASGIISTSLISYGSTVSLAMQNNGKIVVAGSTTDPAMGTLLILQFLP